MVAACGCVCCPGNFVAPLEEGDHCVRKFRKVDGTKIAVCLSGNNVSQKQNVLRDSGVDYAFGRDRVMRGM